MSTTRKETIEYSAACMCIFSAITIGTTSMMISETHDIASGILIFIAQLLLFAASVFHINYKLSAYGESKSQKNEQ